MGPAPLSCLATMLTRRFNLQAFASLCNSYQYGPPGTSGSQ
jgi:hypothetical protein